MSKGRFYPPGMTHTKRMRRHFELAMACVIVQATTNAMAAPNKVVDVKVTGQTQSVPTKGDAADDVAIWVDASDASQSRIIATDKKAGLVVYDLSGEITQTLPVGRINNVDLRAGFMIDGKERVLIAGSERDANAARLWLVDEASGALVDAPGQRVSVGVPEPYGICIGRMGVGKDAKTYLFTSDRTRGVVQHELAFRDGKIEATLVRRFETVGEIEGMVVDDEMGVVYLSEEDACLWRVPLDPGVTLGRAKADAATPVVLAIDAAAKGADRAKRDAMVVVMRCGAGTSLSPDVEGLAISRVGTDGSIVASSQGDSTFAVFDRALTNEYRGSFRVVASSGIDSVEETDGIDIASASIGASYPFGLLVVQDGKVEGRAQNFKLIGWDTVARAFEPCLPMGSR